MKTVVQVFTLAAPLLFAHLLLAGAVRAEGGGMPEVGNCYDLHAMVTSADASKRVYQFTGKCVFYEVKGDERDDKIRNATIVAEYDVQTGKATESVFASGIGGALQYPWQCSGDPWLGSSAACSVDFSVPSPCFSDAYLAYCRGTPPQGSPTGPSPWNQPLHAPLTKPGNVAVQAYVDQKHSVGAMPLILSPAFGESYPVGSLTVQVGQQPPHEQFVLDILDQLGAAYPFPPGAEVVEFEWQRMISGAGPNSTSAWTNQSFLTSINSNAPPPVIDTLGREGEWRMRARHAVPGWPWSSWKKFWIGDKTDYSLPHPIIQTPTPNQLHAQGAQGTYMVDFLITYQGQTSPKEGPAQEQNPAGVDPVELEVELNWFKKGPGETGWGVNQPIVFSQSANTAFSLGLNPGAWRVRARRPGPTAAGFYHPWTGWREFSNGLPPLGWLPGQDAANSRMGTSKRATELVAGDTGAAALSVVELKVLGPARGGQPVSLLVRLKNVSDHVVRAEHQVLDIRCTAPTRATCEIPQLPASRASALQPGQTRTLTLTVQPSTGGRYAVKVALKGAPGSAGRGLSLVAEETAPKPLMPAERLPAGIESEAPAGRGQPTRPDTPTAPLTGRADP